MAALIQDQAVSAGCLWTFNVQNVKLERKEKLKVWNFKLESVKLLEETQTDTADPRWALPLAADSSRFLSAEVIHVM